MNTVKTLNYPLCYKTVVAAVQVAVKSALHAPNSTNLLWLGTKLLIYIGVPSSNVGGQVLL